MIRKISLKKQITRENKFLLPHSFPSYSESNNIAILFNLLEDSHPSDSDLKSIRSFFQESNVNFYYFRKNPKRKERVLWENEFCNQDFGFFGNKFSEKVKKFTNISFDYLICMNTSPFLPFQILASQSKTLCRVSLDGIENHQCFELSLKIESDKNPIERIKETVKYIKMLN